LPVANCRKMRRTILDLHHVEKRRNPPSEVHAPLTVNEVKAVQLTLLRASSKTAFARLLTCLPAKSGIAADCPKSTYVFCHRGSGTGEFPRPPPRTTRLHAIPRLSHRHHDGTALD